MGHQLGETCRGVPGMEADRPNVDLVARQQSPGDACVLGRDQRHRAQDVERPEGHVAQVADRSRDDVQRRSAIARWRPVAHPRAEPGLRRG
jgi:hypothetical protein